MRKVALTGGIATGKSYCLTRFARRGVPTIDADMLARTVVARGEPAWAAVRARFGDEYLLGNGEIDRARLGALVFSDPAARRDLETIVHPAVYDAIRAWYETVSHRSASFALADIPLLYETDHAADFDFVVATWCPLELQIERLRSRDGLSEDEARRRIAAQLPADEKARRANYVIKTNGTFPETDSQIAAIYAELSSDTR